MSGLTHLITSTLALTALRSDAHPASFLDVLLLGEFLPNLGEEPRLGHRVDLPSGYAFEIRKQPDEFPGVYGNRSSYNRIAAPFKNLTTAARGEPRRGCLDCPNYLV